MINTSHTSLPALANALATKQTTSAALIEWSLANAGADTGEGSRVFTKLYSESSMALATVYDSMRAAGKQVPPFAGIPISIKDLFDREGEVTTAGSKVLAGSPPATQDAPVIHRLQQAGFIIVGRTNMTEFAYSGLGLNPHFGTPLNPVDREQRRVPGGSSSGAAISVTDGMAMAAIGTDTGGSCRIPAALCGLVGYKPTANTVDRSGVYPLSFSLDSVGSLATDVSSVSVLHKIMAQTNLGDDLQVDVRDLHCAVPQALVLDDMDSAVARDFERALKQLSTAGVRLTEVPMSCWHEIAQMNAKGGFTAAESYHQQRQRIATRREMFDPRVAVRIMRGKEQQAADYIDLLKARENLIEAFNQSVEAFDGIVFPTVPTVAPMLEPLELSDELYGRTNLLILRNSTTINLVDGCAISIPMNEPGTLPSGITLAAAGGRDKKLLSIAVAIEAILKSMPSGNE